MKQKTLFPLLVIASLGGLFFVLASCGVNIFSYVAPGQDDYATKVEAAKILMDSKDYNGAVVVLTELKEDTSKDSNEVRLMLAAANLGVSGLDIWSVIGTALEATVGTSSADSSSAGGAASSGESSTVFDSLGELLGDGEEKDAKIQALQDAIDGLKTAPNPEENDVKNTACFLAGIMIVPTLADATLAVTSLQTAISAAANGDCDGATGLSTALGDISQSAVRFSLVLETAKTCPFLDVDTSSVEGVNGAMQNLISGADKGCSSIPTAVEALLPACIKKAAGIPNATAVANDSRIDSCEIVLHCSTPSDCF